MLKNARMEDEEKNERQSQTQLVKKKIQENEKNHKMTWK